MSRPTDAAELIHENRGVSTIAIASEAAMPGAIKIGEYMRASTITMIMFAMTTSPGLGRSERIPYAATTPSSKMQIMSAGTYIVLRGAIQYSDGMNSSATNTAHMPALAITFASRTSSAAIASVTSRGVSRGGS